MFRGRFVPWWHFLEKRYVKRGGSVKRELKIFDNPRNVKRLLAIFYVSLVVLLVADFFVHKHADFPWEGATNFFAVYGYVSCVLLIFIAKLMRIFIKRDEKYYD